MKKGDKDLAVTLPEKPALHVQPEGTLEPALLVGHATAEILENNYVELTRASADKEWRDR